MFILFNDLLSLNLTIDGSFFISHEMRQSKCDLACVRLNVECREFKFVEGKKRESQNVANVKVQCFLVSCASQK